MQSAYWAGHNDFMIEMMNKKETLSAKTSDDLISRDWIIDYCNSKVEHYRQRIKRIEKERESITYDPETQIERFKDEIAIYQSFATEIQDAPSVTPVKTKAVQEWIPVSKKLPEEENKNYWVCTDSGYQCECRWTNVNHFWTDLTTDWHWHIMDIPQYSKIIAWMSLPEPYKEDDEA